MGCLVYVSEPLLVLFCPVTAMEKKHTSKIDKIGAILRRMGKDIARLEKISKDMTKDAHQGAEAGTLDVATGRLLDMTPIEIEKVVTHLHNARIVLENAVLDWPKECWPKEWTQ